MKPLSDAASNEWKLEVATVRVKLEEKGRGGVRGSVSQGHTGDGLSASQPFANAMKVARKQASFSSLADELQEAFGPALSYECANSHRYHLLSYSDH